MARSRGSHATREQRWRNILSDWESSGLSVRAFCRTHGVAEPSFYYWRRELAIRDRRVSPVRAASNGPVEAAFVPVRVVAAEPIEVVVRSGQVVRVSATFDAAHLRAVVTALEALPC